MRPIQEPGFARLDAENVQAMLKRHIPYRQWLLDDAIYRIPAKNDQDNQAFESGAIAGRILLSFLGIGFNDKTGSLKSERKHMSRGRRTDDVKVCDVGGRFAELAELDAEETLILAKFIHGTHKACAHFTIGSDHELTIPIYRASAAIIQRLMQQCLPGGKTSITEPSSPSAQQSTPPAQDEYPRCAESMPSRG